MILKIWRLIFGGCDHEYEQVDKIRITGRRRLYPYDSRCIGYEYHQQCKKCGNMRRYTFEVD